MSDQDTDMDIQEQKSAPFPVDLEINADGVKKPKFPIQTGRKKLTHTLSHNKLEEDYNNGPLFKAVNEIKHLPWDERQKKLGEILMEFTRNRPNARLFHWVGHWRGIIVQYDGATGQVLDQSVMEVKIGLKDTRFSRLAVRTSRDGTVNRSFGLGELVVNDQGQIVASIKIGDFESQMYLLSKHMAAFQVDAVAANKNVHVHGVVSVIDDSNRVSSRQIFLGKRVILEHSRETKIFSLPEFLEVDPGEGPVVSDDEEETNTTDKPVRETLFG